MSAEQDPTVVDDVLERLHQQLRSDWKQGKDPAAESLCVDQPPDVLRAFQQELRLVERLFSQFEQRLRQWNQHPQGSPPTLSDVAGSYSARIQETLKLYKRIHDLIGLPSGGSHDFSEPPQIYQIGQIVLGRYEIREILKSGGQGIVYKAWDRELERVVAIKGPGHAAGSTGKLRLAQEGKMTAALEHPNILPIYSFGFDPIENPCFAIKFIEGKHNPEADESKQQRELSDAIRAFHQSSPTKNDFDRGGDAFASLLESFRAVCEAIDFAHEQGYLHRDIKPQNIMLGTHGEVWVIDWGLAKPLPQLDDSESIDAPEVAPPPPHRQLSMEGSVKGTPSYMSPEQARGDDRVIGPRSDVYNLGATMFELLTDQPPVKPRTTEELQHYFECEPVPSARSVQPHVPRALEAICQKALHFDPKQRYASAKDMARDIELWSRDKPVGAFPDPWFETARRWMKQHRTLVTGAAATVLIGLIAVTSILAIVSENKRQLAIENQKTTDALGAATTQKERAETAEQAERDRAIQLANANAILRERNLRLRQLRYVNQVQVAKQLFDSFNVAGANRVLDTTDVDLRGIEWSYLKNYYQQADQIYKGNLGSYVALSHDGRLIAEAIRQFDNLHEALRDPSDSKKWKLRVTDLATKKQLWQKPMSGKVDSLRFDATDDRLIVRYFGFTDFLDTFGGAMNGAMNPDKNVDPLETLTEKLAAGKLVPKLKTGNDAQPTDSIRFWDVKEGMKLEPSENDQKSISQPQNFVLDAARSTIDFPGRVSRPIVLPPHLPADSIETAAVSVKHRLMVTAHFDHGIRIWLAPFTNPFLSLPTEADSVTDVRILDNGSVVWKGTSGDSVLARKYRREAIWQFRPVTPSGKTERPDDWPDQYQIQTMRYGVPWFLRGPRVTRSHDGRVFAALQQDDSVSVWNIESLQRLCQIPVTGANLAEDNFSMALNGDGSTLAIAGLPLVELVDLEEVSDEHQRQLLNEMQDKPVIGIFDTATGEFRGAIPNVRNPVSFMRGEDYLLVACSSEENAVVVSPKFFWHARTAVEVSFSPTSLMADSNLDRLIVGGLRNMLTSPVKKSDNDESSINQITRAPVTGVSLSADGEILVVIMGNEAQVWEANSLNTLSFLRDHSKRINDVAFSNDRSRVATASNDGTVKLWDVQTGTLLFSFYEPTVSETPYWFVTFGKNDLELIAGSENGIVRWRSESQ